MFWAHNRTNVKYKTMLMGRFAILNLAKVFRRDLFQTRENIESLNFTIFTKKCMAGRLCKNRKFLNAYIFRRLLIR